MKFKKQRLWATALAAILTISAGVLPAQAAEVNMLRDNGRRISSYR